jgi:hypothetical protein
MVSDVGSIPVPHTLLSSRRHFRAAALEGSRSPKAYAGLSVKRGMGDGDATTYLVQIVN